MMPRLDLDAIRAAHPLPVVAGAVVKLKRAGNELVGCCPFHQDRSPSFTVFDGGNRFHCFGCSADGDVLDFVQRLHHVTLPQAAEMLCGGSMPRVEMRSPPSAPGRETVEEARTIWTSATDASCSPVSSYLAARGIMIAIPSAIRFARLRYGKKGPTHPCMIALVTDVGGRPIGIQRTYLNAAGTGKAAVPKPKLSLGHVRGGAIRLAADIARYQTVFPGPITGLMLTEGVEDGLSLMQMHGGSAWAAAGAGMLAAMRLPSVISSVIIGADADATGRDAAQKAAEAFRAAGRTARIIYPLAPAKDFNEELTGNRS